MIYIITALTSEAKPLINHYALKRNSEVDFLLYENSEILLSVTQVGYGRALHVTEKLLRYKTPSEGDILVNTGLCAAPKKYTIGDLLLIDKLHFQDKALSLTCKENLHIKRSSLTTLTHEQYENLDKVVDMEAFAIYESAKEFFTTNQLLFIKIVSDHFKPKSLTKNLAYGLINTNITDIASLIKKVSLCQQQ